MKAVKIIVLFEYQVEATPDVISSTVQYGTSTKGNVVLHA